MGSAGELIRFPSGHALASGAADLIQGILRTTLDRRNKCAIALSGGSTPRDTYRALTRHPFISAIPWDNVLFFWSDERYVPPGHPESNFAMAREALLNHLPAPRVHRIHTELDDPAAAAHEYENTLRKTLGIDPWPPQLDLVLLGLGTDGHTASIFPGSPHPVSPDRVVAAPWVPQLNSHRITMTERLLNAAANVVFIVSGAGKADILNQVREGQYQPDKLPAQRIQPVSGRLLWLADADAAAHSL